VRRLVVLLLVLLTALAAAPAWAEEVPPAEPVPAAEPLVPEGVSIGGIPVGGMTALDAAAAVQAAFDEPLRFTFKKRRWHATPAQLDARAYVDGAVTRSLAAAPGSAVDLVVTVRGQRVREYVAYLDRVLSKPARDSQLALRGNRPFLSKPRNGVQVVRTRMTAAIVRALRTGDRGPIPLEADILKPEVTRLNFGPVVIIQRGSKRLEYYEGTRLVRRFGVATGQAAYPTPIGRFTIVTKARNPWWHPPDSDWAEGAEPIPPGPGNPLGTRWMGISAPGVGIHGTPDPASIGYSASHGCIRMLISDAEWLFNHVNVGTTVFIVRA
jgi:lipoprotein-anchoring transpeptidase ErfK/SrfK